MTKRERSQTFPVRVTIGNVTVKIYKVTTGAAGAYEAYAIADRSSGKRKLRKFSNFSEAKAEAQRIAVNLANHDAAAAQVNFRDAATLIRCEELLKPFNVDLSTAVELFTKAASLVGTHRVVEAAEIHSRKFPVAMAKLPLPDAVDDYVKALASKGRGERHLADVRSRLKRFASDHPGKYLHELTTKNLQDWLDSLESVDGKPLSALSKRNQIRIVSAMLDHHRRRGKLTENPADDVEREKSRKTGDIEFWSVAEAKALLTAAPPDAKPALATALFCGIRSAELVRLTRKDFDFENWHVAVASQKPGTASRRLSPIPENLRQWLQPFAKVDPRTPLAPCDSADRWAKIVTEICTNAEIRRVENGARHSAITFLVALHGDIGRVAMDCGNSVPTINTHYRGLATKTQAEAFFSILP